jgi:hypothetical protein
MHQTADGPWAILSGDMGVTHFVKELQSVPFGTYNNEYLIPKLLIIKLCETLAAAVKSGVEIFTSASL